MTITSTDYALLAEHSYRTPESDPRKREVILDGAKYKIFDHTDNPATGFQATAYQRVDTGEVVIAYRGTEFGREPVHDGTVDAGMALAGINAQAPDARVFTHRVLALAKADSQLTPHPLNVTVTGHSLGGTLAELEAHKFGLKGETFNAFGAAGLVHGVPKGGHQVINHVRAGDPVSAASAHFGEVRTYAAQQDIDTLGKAGYREDGGTVSARNPIKAIDFGAHSIDNFVPNSQTLGQSILSPESQARYRAHHSMIDRYRSDVYDARAIASVPLQTGMQAGQAVGHGVNAVGHAAGLAYDATRDAAVKGAQRAGQALDQAGKALHDRASQAVDKLTRPGSWLGSQADPTPLVPLLSDPAHPGNGLFKQAQAGMQAIDAKYGRLSDHQTDNAAGHVAVKAQCARMTCIEIMELGGTKGDKIIAIQGSPGSVHSKLIDVPTMVALNTPLAESSRAFVEEQAQQQRQQRAQQLNQPAPMQSGPVLA
ncbi:hypothetical protein QTH89_17645 [Variovorax sp. J22G21]|uniref:XVIPCD domain-containing protein n=1 Tax=Variovorax fucosicus TaxID=3053517 RepID=UPI00257797F3|nr:MULTISPECIES: XVIPCD domain-containing protein [unclassified Variovorax]MDM0038257.1 hypothetical protein [Variovorax sp. J22R193]MDM0063033.1 hypothetical protein [Variovorax sp. J22G21]